MKFCNNVGDPSHFPTPLPNCLCRVLFSRYSPLSIEVVEKPNKCKNLLAPNFSGGTTPTFLRHIVRAAYGSPFDKVWLSSVCWSLSAKPWQWSGMRNLHRVGKNAGRVWSCLWTKVHDILGHCRRRLVGVNALDRLSISCFIPKI